MHTTCKWLKRAPKNKQDIVPYLIDHYAITPITIAETISVEFGEPLFDLDVFDPALILKDRIDEKLIRKYRVMPLVHRGHVLYVATCNPTNLEAMDAIRFNSKLKVEPIIVEHDKLERLLNEYFPEDSRFNFDTEDFDLDLEVNTPLQMTTTMKKSVKMKPLWSNTSINY